MASLFHYTRMHVVIEHILPGMVLATNKLSNTNDPREAQLWSFGSTNLPLDTLFPEYYSNETNIECQYKFGQLLKDHLQVVCFSGANHRGWDNEMMWAHYCQNHYGVCLEFDEDAIKSELSKQLNNTNYYLENVSYEVQKKKPWIEWNPNLAIDTNFKNCIVRWNKEIALTKSHFWEKEDEKRLIIISKEKVFLPIKSSLKAIHLDLNFSHKYLPSIERLIEGLDVSIYDMVYQNYMYERWQREPNSTQIPIGRKFLDMQ